MVRQRQDTLSGMLDGYGQREAKFVRVPVSRAAGICSRVFRTRQRSVVQIDPRQAVARQQVCDLIAAANRRLVFAAKARRPGETDCGREIVFVARPDSQVRIFGVLADQRDRRQRSLYLSAVMECFIERSPRNAEEAGIAIDWTARPVIARSRFGRTARGRDPSESRDSE